MIAHEFMTIGSPKELSAIAAERKPRMLLLPYGIPICVGALGFFLGAALDQYSLPRMPFE